MNIHPFIFQMQAPPKDKKMIGKKSSRGKKEVAIQPIEKKKRKCRATHIIFDYKNSRIRSSPRRLMEAFTTLTTAQNDWIKENGFEVLSDFKFPNLVHRIGFYVITNYDPENNIVTLDNGDQLVVNEEEVQRILGLPRGEKEIQLDEEGKDEEGKDEEVKDDVKQRWKSQFDRAEVDNPSRVSPALVTHKIQKSTEADEFFRMNFVILMANVLIAPLTSNYVNQDLLMSNLNFNECAQYNWCAYLIKELKRARKVWKEEDFFTGSLAFLVVSEH